MYIMGCYVGWFGCLWNKKCVNVFRVLGFMFYEEQYGFYIGSWVVEIGYFVVIFNVLMFFVGCVFLWLLLKMVGDDIMDFGVLFLKGLLLFIFQIIYKLILLVVFIGIIFVVFIVVFSYGIMVIDLINVICVLFMNMNDCVMIEEICLYYDINNEMKVLFVCQMKFYLCIILLLVLQNVIESYIGGIDDYIGIDDVWKNFLIGCCWFIVFNLFILVFGMNGFVNIVVVIDIGILGEVIVINMYFYELNFYENFWRLV